MTTKEGFRPEDYRAQAQANLESSRGTDSVPFNLGKSAGYLENAADYITVVNRMLKLTLEILELPEDNSPEKKALFQELKDGIREILA